MKELRKLFKELTEDEQKVIRKHLENEVYNELSK